MAVAFNPIEANNLKLGKYLYESSYLLGIGKIKTLLKIEFPLLSNILTSTFILLFIDVLKELPLTLILKPYKVQTLAVQAYAYAEDERIELAAAPALVLIAVIVSLMLLLNLIKKRVNRNKAYRS